MAFLGWVHRFRGVLTSPPLVLALLWPRPETSGGWPFWLPGAGMVLLGVALRAWAQQHLRHRLKTPVELTTSGPFQFVRNPLYIGNTLLCVGATLTAGVFWLVPVTLVWCLAIFSLVVRYEEARMLEQYGEPYRRYQAEVPRWFPRPVRGLSLGLVTEYFRRAILTELPSLLILVPFIVKAAAPRWFCWPR